MPTSWNWVKLQLLPTRSWYTSPALHTLSDTGRALCNVNFSAHWGWPPKCPSPQMTFMLLWYFTYISVLSNYVWDNMTGKQGTQTQFSYTYKALKRKESTEKKNLNHSVSNFSSVRFLGKKTAGPHSWYLTQQLWYLLVLTFELNVKHCLTLLHRPQVTIYF